MSATPAKRTGAKVPVVDGVDQDPSMDFEDVTVDPDDKPEAPTAAAPDVQQAVLDVLASLGLTGADVAALAKEKRAKANHESVDLNAGTFPDRIAAHRVRAAEVKAEDPDLADRLLLTARGLQAEHKLATARGSNYRAHADICDEHFPDGWPLGSHHASCEHGEYDR